MNNPFDDLSTLEEWTAALAQPDDGIPDFNQTENPEINTALRLDGDRKLLHPPRRRLFKDYRSQPDAFRHIDPLPQPEETLHGLISGRYALADLIPALIERTGCSIKHLYIATLSFNKQNAADLLGLLDDGYIAKLSLIISYYFKSTSREIYDLLIPELRSRGHEVLSMRNHCKILLSSMSDGTKYVVESSANLRSSVNLEQFCLTNSEDLYAFHVGWMDELLRTGKELG